ncbi:uncharacterized protein LY79DRAFT_188562 [Colletotrichum navitas]|uniref:Uncharacterized protein n=1 Tax=Colletotrichum navitas TaxID=681940 RepID=A0AAD8V633_9PEZI|nr:uncharacterized protein LY79DRAFT_188562 [Colletotrichum navitas]KAK1593136.1 hypothetical protein LY79DRAFT_188562 [Colletotrichum navitas]
MSSGTALHLTSTLPSEMACCLLLVWPVSDKRPVHFASLLITQSARDAVSGGALQRWKDPTCASLPPSNLDPGCLLRLNALAYTTLHLSSRESRRNDTTPQSRYITVVSHATLPAAAIPPVSKREGGRRLATACWPAGSSADAPSRIPAAWSWTVPFFSHLLLPSCPMSLFYVHYRKKVECTDTGGPH